ncbi:hypothetical protein MLP_47370 [Microlunatus phosphovorus NM-1]|uniref:Uncharacterized protein n=1 Tax=Microlunatus phosphovorus (strain ATCC 700054 / DSM 10555 / JCM 9379 / NBRC 101784 / NCIMB 13414 / VKM Ac-1990 / NM-1) TaxID=1032480 RepID=F5XF13_MICPN|nr:hypothetical protein MLP_47370 [Microlunatus phosphovorus NM-1]
MPPSRSAIPPDRARSRRSGADLWPGGARGASCAPGRRSSVARRHERYAVRAWSTVVCGPVAREVRRARLVDGRLWPGGARGTPCRPGQRSSVAPRRKTYGRVRATAGRRWPRGAKRLSIPSEPRTSLARRRQPDRRPQVTPPRSPLRTSWWDCAPSTPGAKKTELVRSRGWDAEPRLVVPSGTPPELGATSMRQGCGQYSVSGNSPVTT